MSIIESKYPILVLSYNNCEIHCCHLDGYKDNKDALLNRLTEIEDTFLSKQNNVKYKLWFNMDSNVLDEDIMEEVCSSIFRISNHIYKIGFIGLRILQRRKFEKLLKKKFKHYGVLYHAYFSDAEEAKEWLV